MEVLAGFLLLLCCSVHLHAAGEGGEGVGGEGGSSKAMSPCGVSSIKLNSIIGDLFSEGLTVYTNCLSFGKTGALEKGVVSGVNETGGPGLRLVLSCVEEVIAAKPSMLPPVASNMNTTACEQCTDTAVEEEICGTSCLSPCERCYASPTSCTRCIACVEPELDHCYVSEGAEEVLDTDSCMATCDASRNMVVNTELFNFCDCQEGHYKQLLQYPPAVKEEGEIPETCNPAEPELEPFRCVASCEENEKGGYAFNEELQRCFACGREYCVDQCRGNSTVGECDVCLFETEIYDHECFACPKSLVVRNAEEQEEELREEEREQEPRQRELAVFLPIACVLVTIFFVGMSLFAHYRYPHVNPQGHKRHRTKPEDLDNIIEDAPSDLESSQAVPADVWRARPTIRLR